MRKKNKHIPLSEASDREINEAYAASTDGSRGGNAFVTKLRSLWSDKRKFSVRAILAALCALTFAFTFIVFGPYEVYISNMQYITFHFSQMVLPMALAGLVVFAVLFLVLIALRGKIFNYALSALFAVTLAGYLQCNFLNVDHGALDGAGIAWADFASTTILNIAVWFAVALAVFAVLYFSRKVWAVGIQLVCIMLIGAQAVALCSLVITTDFPTFEETPILTTEGAYTVTEGENVVFFLLDRFDNSYVEEMFERYPEFKDKLGGFTRYNNFTGSYTRTMPSITYLLTGVQCDYTIHFNDYFKKAWTESTFIKDIRDAGYNTRLYTDTPYVFGTNENVKDLLDNITVSQPIVNHKQLYKHMLNLSAYRSAPEALKPSFWMYTGDLTTITSGSTTDGLSAFTINDVRFWQDYREGGLTVDEDSKGTFSFYHFSGAHNPHYMDENGNEAPYTHTPDNMYRQIAGNMNGIFDYIDELKEKGLYDNTTIIISADHGWTDSLQALDFERLLALFIKPANADATKPLQVSGKQICQDNLRASIISYFGLDSSSYGRTIESIGEDEEMVRYFWMQACNPDRTKRDIHTVTYKIVGDAKDFSNWEEISRVPIQYPFYDTDETDGL